MTFKVPDHATMREADIYWQGVRDGLHARECPTCGQDKDIVPVTGCTPVDPEDWINHGGSI